MIDAQRVAEIVNDPRLTPDAVRLILAVATRGEGPQEIEADDLRLLLGCKSERPVYNARDRATRHGYIRWKQGGKAHANVYEYLGHRYEVKADTSATGTRYSRVDDEGDVVPPIVPLWPLSPEAEAAIERHAKLLTGCRDALRDYLRRRVTPPRQSAYVNDIAGKINGLGFNWKGLAAESRPGLVAASLNELAATDEASQYKNPAGDPRNLRTKLGIMVDGANGWGGRRQATGSDGRRSPRDLPADQQDYGEGTTSWGGLKS